MSKCELFQKLSTEFDAEIKGHKIREDYAKNPTKKYNEYIEIADTLHTQSMKCKNDQPLTIDQCIILKRGTVLWEEELEFWGNKWYIKPFIRITGSWKKNKEFIKNLQDVHQNECK